MQIQRDRPVRPVLRVWPAFFYCLSCRLDLCDDGAKSGGQRRSDGWSDWHANLRPRPRTLGLGRGHTEKAFFSAFVVAAPQCLYRTKAVAGIGSACGPGASTAPPPRESARDARTYTQIPPGCNASAAMRLSGRLEFDSSNHGLC
jgi:hypothetical protein